MYLNEKLKQYSQSNEYPFHMPGHKRQLVDSLNPYAIDITEIDGFDDLHHARGILKEAQERAAALYGAQHSFYLINGSTVGILSAVFGCIKEGEGLLLARNCHKSAYHAAMLCKADITYLYPPLTQACINGSIPPDAVRTALEENPRIKAVFLTSPTYEGVVSDIKAIAEIVHEKQAVLIVDEAHGAHFGLDSDFPQTAVRLGADVVIQSLHKTLPSYTQTALLHCNCEAVLEEIASYLKIFQSSSPSYVLMAGMDHCIHLLETKGKTLFAAYKEQLTAARAQIKEASDAPTKQKKRIRLLEWQPDSGIFQLDPSKLVFLTDGTGYTGKDFYECLRRDYHLQLEMAAGQYAIAMTSIMDTKEGFERLVQAVVEINQRIASKSCETTGTDAGEDTRPLQEAAPKPRRAMQMYEAKQAPQRTVPLSDSAGCISAEFIYAYPPGIPVIVPGEVMDQRLLADIIHMKQQGFSLQGMQDEQADCLKVVAEE